MPAPSPEIFGWLTTEKAAGLVAVVTAIGALWFGHKKSQKEAAATPATVIPPEMLLMIQEITTLVRHGLREWRDDREAQERSLTDSLLTQIRDELRLLRGVPMQGMTPTPKRRRPARKKPSAE